MRLAFADESGNTGFQFHRNSSPFYVITLVLFRSEKEAEEAGARIEALKAEIGKPAMEFHFTNTDDLNRQKFFRALRGAEFTVFAVVCDKTRLQTLKGKHEELLMTAFGAALEGARDAGLLHATSLKYDEAGGNAFQKKLASGLLAKINGAEPGRYISRCEPQRSKGNALIPLADMVCGAIARPYNKPQRQDGDYRELIKHRVNSVLLWP